MVEAPAGTQPDTVTAARAAVALGESGGPNLLGHLNDTAPP